MALTLVAAGPRFYDLGRTGLSGDEDYTYLTAHSVLDRDGSVMPSGMPYRRGLPYTWANAVAAALLPQDNSATYRVVAATAGALTPAALYLTATTLVAPEVALVAATMLALSEWHVRYSRHGRMYAPFVLALVLTGHLFYRWVRTGAAGLLIAASALYALTLALHLLGLIATQFALFALVLPGTVAVSPLVVLAVTGLATWVGYQLQLAIVQAPFGEWAVAPGYVPEGVEMVAPEASRDVSWEPALLVLGVALGLWLAGRLLRTGATRPIWPLAAATISGALATGIFLSAGQLWGATLAMGTLLMVHPVPFRDLLRRGGIPLVVSLLAGFAWAGHLIASFGPGEGIRRAAVVPWPYPLVLWSVSPTLIVIFVGMCVFLAQDDSERPTSGLRAAALAVLVPLAGLGLIEAQGPPRYLLMTYPYLLLCGAYVVVMATRALAVRLHPSVTNTAASTIAMLIVLAGAVPGHGLPSVLRLAGVDYGSALEPAIYDGPYLVDHETAGRFVGAQLAPGDRVIAEDVTIALVYAGRADYWLRRIEDAAPFLYVDADGIARDKYADAELLSTVQAVERVIASAEGRVWLLTSGEVEWTPRFYRSPELASWLAEVEATLQPAVMGRDGVTAAYLLK